MHWERYISKNQMLTVASLLMVILASVAVFLHLNNLMAASQFPPGTSAALQYEVLMHGWISASLPPQELGSHALIVFFSHILGLDPFSAIKISAAFILALLPIFTYILALIVTEDKIAAAASTWIAVFTPAASATILVGDYGATLGQILLAVYLTFTIHYIKEKTSRSLYLMFLAEAFAVLGNINLALFVLPVIAILSFRMYQRKEHSSLKQFLILSLACLAIPILILSVFTSPFQTQTAYFSIDPAIWIQDLWFTLPMAVTAAVGIYTLTVKKVSRLILFILLISAIAPFSFATTSILGSFLALLIPILAIFSASPLMWLKEAVSYQEIEIEKENGPVIEVTVDVPRFAAVILVAFLIVSTVNAGYNTSILLYAENSVSKYFNEEEVVSAAQWITDNLQEEVLITRPAVAAWLEALSGKTVLGFRGPEEVLLAETMDSTSFRIMTPSLIVDEWEPFSVSKAPIISCYDGEEYRPVAYIDDSLVRVHLLKDNKEWIESPYRATYNGYRWLNSSQQEIILVQNFETPGLIFEKATTVSTSDPHVNVSYHVNPKQGVELLGIELPLRIEPWRKVTILDTTNTSTTLVVDGRETRITYSENIVSLTHSEYDEGHTVVMTELKPEEGTITASVDVRIMSDARSQMPLWTAHTPSLMKDMDIEYIVAETGKMGFLDRSFIDPIKSLIIKDSFNRISFESEGISKVEAPSSGTVLSDQSTSNGTRLIHYQTDNLYINKTVTQSDEFIGVTYAVAPIAGSSMLRTMNLTLWIDWGIQLFNYTINGNNVVVELSSGNFEVAFAGSLIHVDVGPDPVWGQYRIQAVLRLNTENDEVGIVINGSKLLMYEYKETTRPDMETEDQINICVDENLFRVVFRQGALIICRTNP